jgi:hypothetical protein
MAAKVIHFGWDDCYRVQVLQRAGFAVTEAKTLAALDFDLQQGELADAVIVAEGTPHTTEGAADIVRLRTAVPLILFRRSQCDLDERKFDVVYPWCLPPEIWLARTAELITQKPASARKL